jgi:hypothetical protein
MAILRRPDHFWPALWGGAALLLLLVILAEHEFGRVTVGEGVRAPAKVVEAKMLPAFALPPDAPSGADTVVRPLFVPTRRQAPPAAAVPVSTMKKGQFVLTGVTVTPDVSIAFLKEVANGKTVGVKKGAQVNGLTVDTVEPRHVVLRQGEESEDLSLSVQVPARTAAAPAPAVPNLFDAARAAGTPPPAPGAPTAPGAPPSSGSPPAAGAVPPGAPLPQGAPAGAGTVPSAPAAQPGQPATQAPATGRRRPWINNQ